MFQVTIGVQCTGVTTLAATGVGLGDYLEIPLMHNVGWTCKTGTLGTWVYGCPTVFNVLRWMNND